MSYLCCWNSIAQGLIISVRFFSDRINEMKSSMEQEVGNELSEKTLTHRKFTCTARSLLRVSMVSNSSRAKRRCFNERNDTWFLD